MKHQSKTPNQTQTKLLSYREEEKRNQVNPQSNSNPNSQNSTRGDNEE